jgi:LmbE family N-acetylglucosaminyl deacetylase
MTAMPFDARGSNTARFAARPLADGGTPTHVWLRTRPRLPTLALADCSEMVVVAAHPDDETLGLGATCAMLTARGVRVQVVSVTDGGAAQPNASPLARSRLQEVRRAELHRATQALDIAEPVSLGLPDGHIGDHVERVADLLTEVLVGRPAGTWCAATWSGDGHPDHEAVGRAAVAAAKLTGVELLQYPVWMWHWAHPTDGTVPWHRAFEIALTDEARHRKHAAAQCFHSQVEAAAAGADPVLPPAVLERLLAVGEVVFR